jgi:hypothetical protein
MKIYRIPTTDVLRAHSYAGAAGWELVDRDEDAPEHALGRYERRGVFAYMMRESSGDLALVTGVRRSGVTVATAKVRL